VQRSKTRSPELMLLDSIEMSSDSSSNLMIAKLKWLLGDTQGVDILTDSEIQELEQQRQQSLRKGVTIPVKNTLEEIQQVQDLKKERPLISVSLVGYKSDFNAHYLQTKIDIEDSVLVGSIEPDENLIHIDTEEGHYQINLEKLKVEKLPPRSSQKQCFLEELGDA